ncbi:ComEA family DNA-binding protein [Pseudomonas japonica]|uniref:Competence protein ComEA n=1 Tax=Pseudomonas japonica TaxID=256466 RepID=A0A239HCI4_9PSED|nr:helix-hairpin-helix domain-containing protein [Pseudomonas japonica]SNS79002.1 competence protein ComEA [Pseudomonas japonica]
MRPTYLTSVLAAFVVTFSLAAGAAPGKSGNAETAPLSISAEQSTGKLDLNKADALTLQRELSGIGEAKSKAIVAYRESNGNFASVDELLEVEGIGKAIVDRNREKITVN